MTDPPTRPKPPTHEREQTMRVATYTRISTDEAHQPCSLDAQTIRLRAYIDSQDQWVHAASFTDQVSGATLERPGLVQALAEAKADRFDLLLVYRVDRLSRSVRGLAQVLEDLDHAGVAFRSATEPFDTTSPAGRMMVQMLAVFAEFERVTIIDRVIAGMERKAAAGGWCGGRESFGYRHVKGEGRLVVEPTEASLVPLVFNRYVNHRWGSHTIAAWLNTNGHRTRDGAPWDGTAILRLIRSRSYLGEVHFRGEWYPSTHPPLVDVDLFDAAQTVLTGRRHQHGSRGANSSDYLLTGLVVCDTCQRRYSGTSASGRNTTYRYYTCSARQHHSDCPVSRVRADHLEHAVIAALLDTYDHTDLFERAAAQARIRTEAARDQDRAELATITAELTKAETAADRYLAAFETGTLNATTCGERLGDLRDRIAQLRHQQDTLTRALDAPGPTPPTNGQVDALRDIVHAALTTGTPATAKHALAGLIHEVRIHDRDTIQPTFRVPDGSDRAPVRAPGQTVGRLGLEPSTLGLKVPCSNQMS